MCLVTTFKEGFIISKDITVYKRLKKRYSKWVTPCREWEVSLDSMLTPDENIPEITETPLNCMIEGGVIHSYSRLEDIKDVKENIFCFKAIIPEGTRFWIQDDLREVASERLYLTSERVYGSLETDFSFLYSSYCLDLLLKDGSRVSWFNKINLRDIKGIFIYDSQTIGLDIYESMFSHRILYNIPDKISDREEAPKDMKGRERTRFLRENYPDIEILKNFPEDSYLPSFGELTKALRGILFINLTRMALGLKILKYTHFWSSTLYSDDSIWCINPGWIGWEWSNWRDYSWPRLQGCVLPFLDNNK